MLVAFTTPGLKMTRIPPFRLTTLSLALLSLVLVVFGALNFQQRGLYQAPDDGVSWIDSPQGVIAWIVIRGGPADRAGIREGDQLRAINGRPVPTAAEAVQQVYRTGVWSLAAYNLVRNGEPFDTSLVLVPQGTASSVRHYLALVGLLYLLIGTYILFRRWTARKSLHFYVFCLASFVLYTFAYTGKLNLFDWTIYWLNEAALLLQPALFLHFCLTFPERSSLIRERRYLVPFLYLPGALLGVVHVLVAADILVLPLSLLQSRWLLDRVELFYLAAYFVAGALALQHSHARAGDPVLKHQLKWVTRGTWLAIVALRHALRLALFPGVCSQRLDECLGAFARVFARHLWLCHCALSAHGCGHHLPPGHCLHTRYGRHCGRVFRSDRPVRGFLPRDLSHHQPQHLGRWRLF